MKTFHYFKNDPWIRPWCYCYPKKRSKIDDIRLWTKNKGNPKSKKEYIEYLKEDKQSYMTWLGGDSIVARKVKFPYKELFHGYKLNYCELFKN
jgi:hypothetical protein